MPDTRGEPPNGGQDPPVVESQDLPPQDPNWQPSRIVDELTSAFGSQLRDRQRDDLWFPKLLIRGAPSDTGERPLWEPTPCWLSPDIHVLPVGPNIDLAAAVLNPQVGSRYTVAVHVWNLSRFPAHGVLVRAWWVEAGFFSGTSPANFIGGTFTQLGDRDSGQAHQVVPIPQPWLVEDDAASGHQCLIATVDAFADPWGGVLDANADRHVAQRNLALMQGADDVTRLLDHLGTQIEVGQTLTVLDGAFRPAPLTGAAERGIASTADARDGAGPIEVGPTRRAAELVRSRDAWFVRGGPELDTGSLGDAVTGVLGASDGTARGLLDGQRLGGARTAALHLATGRTGYTILLHR